MILQSNHFRILSREKDVGLGTWVSRRGRKQVLPSQFSPPPKPKQPTPTTLKVSVISGSGRLVGEMISLVCVGGVLKVICYGII